MSAKTIKSKRDLYLERNCEDCMFWTKTHTIHCHKKCDYDHSSFKPKPNGNHNKKFLETK